MKHIAIIFESDVFDRKGLFNAVLERSKRLLLTNKYHIEVFGLMYYDNFLTRLLRRTPLRTLTPQVTIEGVTINLLWQPFRLSDYILSAKLHYKPFLRDLWRHKIARKFKNFDLIIAHSVSGGSIANNIKSIYDIPFCVVWHGSDIHTYPFSNKYGYNEVKQIINNADTNFFVSKKLMETATKITPFQSNWKVSYNGVAKSFYRYNNEERQKIRKKYHIHENAKVIGFVGNLFPIKQAELLPDIFMRIKSQYQGEVQFIIAGDGKLRSTIQQSLQANGILQICSMLGNVATENILDIMNCIDLLVLPSKNEGLPLVVVESLKCGTPVVGSDVGGIKEVIGEENVVSLGEFFVERFSNRCIEILNSTIIPPTLPSHFDWDKTVSMELSVFDTILDKQ